MRCQIPSNFSKHSAKTLKYLPNYLAQADNNGEICGRKGVAMDSNLDNEKP